MSNTRPKRMPMANAFADPPRPSKKELRKELDRAVRGLEYLTGRVAIVKRKLAIEAKMLQRLQDCYDPTRLGQSQRIAVAEAKVGELEQCLAELENREYLAKLAVRSAYHQLHPVAIKRLPSDTEPDPVGPPIRGGVFAS